jgi:hypothetical protein
VKIWTFARFIKLIFILFLIVMLLRQYLDGSCIHRTRQEETVICKSIGLLGVCENYWRGNKWQLCTAEPQLCETERRVRLNNKIRVWRRANWCGHHLQNAPRLRKRSVSISGTIEESVLMKSRLKCVSLMGNNSCSNGSRPKRKYSFPVQSGKYVKLDQMYWKAWW